MALALENFSATGHVALSVRIQSGRANRDSGNTDQIHLYATDGFTPEVGTVLEGSFDYDAETGTDYTGLLRRVAINDNDGGFFILNTSTGLAANLDTIVGVEAVTVVRETTPPSLVTLEANSNDNGSAGFVDWRLNESGLTQAEWNFLNAIQANDEIILAFHAGTASYVVPAAPVFADDTGDAQSWTQNQAITPITVPAATGEPTPTYAAVGNLPSGIAFDGTTRVISGTPTAVGSGTITIRATNSEGSDDWTLDYTIAGVQAIGATASGGTGAQSAGLGKVTPGTQAVGATAAGGSGAQNVGVEKSTLQPIGATAAGGAGNQIVEIAKSAAGTKPIGATVDGGAGVQSVGVGKQAPGVHSVGATASGGTGAQSVGLTKAALPTQPIGVAVTGGAGAQSAGLAKAAAGNQSIGVTADGGIGSQGIGIGKVSPGTQAIGATASGGTGAQSAGLGKVIPMPIGAAIQGGAGEQSIRLITLAVPGGRRTHAGVRSLMRHRATVERDEGTQTDPFGGTAPAVRTIHFGDLPCYVQSRRESTIADGQKFVAVVSHSLWAPLGADLEAEDVVTQVTDLRGNVVLADRLRLLAPVQRENHLEFNLEAYR